MAVLPRHVERIFSRNEVPAHRGMARAIGPSIANGQAPQGRAPAIPGVEQAFNWIARGSEEKVVMPNGPLRAELGVERELTLRHGQSARAEPNQAVLPRLSRVSLHAMDFRFADPQRPVFHVQI